MGRSTASPPARATRAAGSLAVLALLWGAMLGYALGERGRGAWAPLLVAVTGLLGGWGLWRDVRAAIGQASGTGAADASAPTTPLAAEVDPDAAAVAAGAARHEAQVRPTPRNPNAQTVSDGRGLTWR